MFSILDNQMAELTARYCKGNVTFQPPVHLNVCLTRGTSFKDLVEVIVKHTNCVTHSILN